MNEKIEHIVKPYSIANRLGRNYSIFPASLVHSKINLKNVKLLGNGIVWFDKRAYQLNIDKQAVNQIAEKQKL